MSRIFEVSMEQLGEKSGYGYDFIVDLYNLVFNVGDTDDKTNEFIWNVLERKLVSRNNEES